MSQCNHKPCANITLKGRYVGTFTGDIILAAFNGLLKGFKNAFEPPPEDKDAPPPPPFVPAAALGVIEFDGEGNLTLEDFPCIGGYIVKEWRTATGTYTVKHDCSGEIAVSFQKPFEGLNNKFRIRIYNSGKSFQAIATGQGTCLACTFTRQ